MKFLRLLIVALTAGSMFSSCQKEYSAEGGIAQGSLKADLTGDCLPIMIHGNFKKDTVIKDTNYAQIQLNITRTGTYFIKTDTVNGYSFSGAGVVSVAGTNTIRLRASGKPIAPGVDIFTIKFDTSECKFNVTVTGTGGGGGITADFSLAGSPSSCMGAVVSGTYTQGVATGTTNTANINVNVTTAGSYVITTSAVNGVTFMGTGTLATGAQTITLFASGTPIASGPFTYPLAAGTSTCSFSVTYAPGTPPATYTIDCTGATPAGTYQAGTATTSSNTVTISATSTGMGSYSITTPMVNGVSFSGSGSFAGAGTQSVTLTAMGTPGPAAGTFNYTATAATGGSTCSFSVTYAPGTPPASYTIDCTGATPAGTYQAGTATTSSNTVTISATSTGAGSYNITTNPMNGVTFSGSGSFAGAGTQAVTLTAMGTPTMAGTFNYTATASTGGSTCNFSVTYTGGMPPPTQFITATVGGVPKTFSTAIMASFNNGSSPAILLISGSNAAGDEFMDLEIDFPGSSIPAGTYDVNSMTYFVDGTYTNPGGVIFEAQSGSPNPLPSFQIKTNNTITMTPTTVTGSFSGAVNDALGNVIQITNGLFSVNL